VIVDAVDAVEPAKEMWRALSQKYGAELLVIE
jgi:hypothetical protein